MWVFTHSLLASHSSSECQDCRDQSLNKCLSSACYSIRVQGLQEASKLFCCLRVENSTCLPVFLQHFKSLRVASRRGESHLFFIPPLLYKHTRGSIDPSDGLDQYRSSFIANFYRKRTYWYLGRCLFAFPLPHL